MKVTLALALGLGFGYQAQAQVKQCGIQGTVEQRIKDCNVKRGAFALVSRYASDKEIYKDLNNGLIWSETLPGRYVYYQNASGICSKQQKEFGGLQLNWKMPTICDYMDAIDSGMQRSLPNIYADAYWSSTPDKFYVNSRYIFEGNETYAPTEDGGFIFRHLEVEFSARVKCVAK